ncbi:MAG: LPS export ABC transporter permease LptF [Gammaproteobacteria bacterium]|nr:LPS export ABC transporter permease LptF [Gammaproteobacteria bacterium]
MIIDRYLTREVASTFIAVSAVLVIIFATFSMGRFLTDAASGLLRPIEVAELTALKALIALEVLLPIGLYFGLIITLGALHGHSELIALQACGIGERRFHRPALRVAMLLAALVALLSTQVRPWAYARTYGVIAAAEASSEINRIKAGEFYLYEGENRVVFVNEVDGDQLRGVFIRTRTGTDIQVVSAANGRIELYHTPETHRLTLSDAHILKQIDGGPDFTGMFNTLTLALGVGKPEDSGYHSKARSTLDLAHSNLAADRAEFQWRLSTPVSTLLLAMLALQLSRNQPRAGRFARLPQALAVYAVYYNLLGIARNWIEQQTVAYLWWVPALLAVILLYRAVPEWRVARRWA